MKMSVRIFAQLDQEEDGNYFSDFKKNQMLLREVILGCECELDPTRICVLLEPYDEKVRIIRARPSDEAFEMVEDTGILSLNAPEGRSSWRNTNMDTVISVLRWITILPGAAIAAALARGIVGALNAWTVPDADGFVAQFGIGCIMGTVFVLALVFSGAWIAPSKKNAVGLVLTVLFLLMGGVSVGMVVFGASTSIQISDPMMLGELIASLATSGYVLVMAWLGKDIFDASGFFRD